MRLRNINLCLMALLTTCKSSEFLQKSDSNSEVLSSKSGNYTKVCQEQQDSYKNVDGLETILCKKLFSNRPFIRPPTDNKKDLKNASFYAGLHISPYFGDGVYFVDRTGAKYLVLDKKGKLADFASLISTAFPKNMHAPSNRYLNTIYYVTGLIKKNQKIANHENVDTIELKSAEPRIIVTGCASDSMLLGTWYGTVTKRLSKPSGHPPILKYFTNSIADKSSSVPIHITFSKIKYGRKLAEWDGGLTFDNDGYILTGTIDNMYKKLVLPTGESFSALTDLGDENPFFKAKTNEVELYRLSNMHGIGFDSHWVFTYPEQSDRLSNNGMSDTLDFFSPLDLIAEVPSSFSTVTIKPHVPYRSSGHIVRLGPSNYGGQSGTCPSK